jgi:hypothetical protein
LALLKSLNEKVVGATGNIACRFGNLSLRDCWRERLPRRRVGATCAHRGLKLIGSLPLPLKEALLEMIGEIRWRAMCTVLRDTTRIVRHRTVTAD